jgi:hypothetical protein
MPSFRLFASCLFFWCCAGLSIADDKPLHERIDQLIATEGSNEHPPSDADYLRRASLDLIGRIPTYDEAQQYLADDAADKRVRLIDRLLTSPEHPRHMAETFHILLMERRGDDEHWQRFLRVSFAENTPWDKMAREMLAPNASDEERHGSAFFMTKRLEKVGANPTDHPGLTRDISRLFLGMDLQCAQCHDHLFIDDYRQRDFQGLFTVYSSVQLRRGAKTPAVEVKPPAERLSFTSVFEATSHETGPRVPGRPEIPFEPSESVPKERPEPDPLLAALASDLTSREHRQFSRNIVNRLWHRLVGRGLVWPLDLHHSGNPATHPELLELLTDEFIANDFNLRLLVREIALSQAYEKASEKRLSAEQTARSVLVALGTTESKTLDEKFASVIEMFRKSLANEAQEPEDGFNSSVKSALFLLNDAEFLALFEKENSPLIECLSQRDDAAAVAEQLYLSVFSRRPSDEERNELVTLLADPNWDRSEVLKQVAWAMITSVEFQSNH